MAGQGWVGIDEPWVYPALAAVPMLVSLLGGTAFYGTVWLVLMTLLDAAAFALLLRSRRGRGIAPAAWWLGFLVATPVVLYAGRPFFAGALRSLKARRPGMDVPVALAVAGIYVASLIEAVRGGEHVYFESVSMFVFFLLIGRYVEMRARHRAGAAGLR